MPPPAWAPNAYFRLSFTQTHSRGNQVHSRQSWGGWLTSKGWMEDHDGVDGVQSWGG